MNIGAWVDTRIQNAIAGAIPKVIAGVDVLLSKQTTDLFAKLDAQSQAFSALALADAKQIGEDVEHVADTVTGDIASLSTGLLNQLRSFIPHL